MELMALVPISIGMWSVGHIFVRRSSRRSGRSAVLQAEDQVRQSSAKVLFFPEGTRSLPDAEPLPWRMGAFALAVAAQVPVQPSLSSEPVTVGRPISCSRAGGGTARFLPPVYTEGLAKGDRLQLKDQVAEMVTQQLKVQHKLSLCVAPCGKVGLIPLCYTGVLSMNKLFAATILMIGGLAHAQDAHEPNNSFDTATPISPGQPLKRRSTEVATTSTITRSMSRSGPVIIETFGNAGDTRMWLYGQDQAQIAYNDDGGNALFSRIQRDTMAPGTYYVKVDEFGNNANISYNLRVNLIEGELRVGTPEFGPAPQPGQTWGVAIDVINANAGPVDSTVASLTVAGDNLAPCNVPPLAGNASHTCRWTNLPALPPGYHLARVCADADFAVGELNENDNCAEFLAPPLVAGDPDAYEPNNTFDDAAEINHGDDLVLTTHNNGQDIDYFRFVLDREGNLVIQTRPVVADDSDSRIQLFDEDQQLITQAGFGFGHPTLTRNNMAAGTYYIRTEEFGNNAQMRYILSLRMVTGSITIGEVTMDPEPLVGQTWGLSAAVQNAHNSNSPELVAQLHINGEAQADCAVPALEPGRNHSCSWPELAGLAIGAHTVEFCADTDNAVLENNENDNCRAIAI